jgi:uncharacterized protein with HEPN domain
MPRRRRDLIHNYFGINVEGVQDTITNNLPALKRGVARALRAERAAERAGTGREPAK